jgi:predicted secreted Zn-dependent protease
LAACAHAAAVEAPDHPAFTGVPKLTFKTYAVSGSTAEEIRQSLIARRPRDPQDGQAVDALSGYTINWAIPFTDAGRCELKQAQLSFRGEILLPALADRSRVAPDVLARWDAFVASLEEHEAWHIRYAWGHVDDVRRAIRSSSCAEAEQAAAAKLQEIAEAQHAYDVAARHGASEVVPFP